MIRGLVKWALVKLALLFLESSRRLLQRPLDSLLRTGYTLNFYFVLRLEKIYLD